MRRARITITAAVLQSWASATLAITLALIVAGSVSCAQTPKQSQSAPPTNAPATDQAAGRSEVASPVQEPVTPTPSPAAAGARAQSPSAQVQLGRDFEVRIGETVAIDGEPLTATFERVVEDSRCPTNTTCIWAGDAVVRVRLRGASAESGMLDLHTLSDVAREGDFQNYRVRLVGLVPAPQDPGRIPGEKYLATLNIRKNGRQ